MRAVRILLVFAAMILERIPMLICMAILLVGVMAVGAQGAEYAFSLIADTSGEIGTFRIGPTPVDNFGNVAFRADLDNGIEGVFKGNGGSLTTIALNEGQFAGYHFANHPLMNSVGTVAFGGNGVFVSDGETVVTIAEVGPVFRSIAFTGQINNAGQVTFAATAQTGIMGTYVGSGGPPTLVADPTGQFMDFNGNSTINDGGAVAFRAALDNGILGTFLSSEGTITTIAEERDPFVFVDTGVINSNNSVAFRARLTAGGEGIFVWSNGTIEQFIDTSGPFRSTSPVKLTDAGQVIFAATFDSGGSAFFVGPDPIRDRIIGTGDSFGGSTIDLVFGGGVNDYGTIATGAVLADGRVVVIRADPISEPAGLVLLVAGLATVCILRRRIENYPVAAAKNSGT